MHETSGNLPTPAQRLCGHSKGIQAVLAIHKQDTDKKADLDMLCTRLGVEWRQDGDNNVCEDNAPETLPVDYFFDPDCSGYTTQDNKSLWDQTNSNMPGCVFDQVL